MLRPAGTRVSVHDGTTSQDFILRWASVANQPQNILVWERAKDCETWYQDSLLNSHSEPRRAVHDFAASSPSAPPAHKPHPISHLHEVEFYLPHNGDDFSARKELQREYLMGGRLGI